MPIKRKLAVLIFAALALINVSGASSPLKDLLLNYNFDSYSGINVTYSGDFMTDSDNDGVNDTLVFELEIDNALNPGYYVLNIALDDGALAFQSNASLPSGISRINMTLGTYLLEKNKLNYSITAYNASYGLKFRKGRIETKEHYNYESGFSLIEISDRRIGNSLMLNLTINSAMNVSDELTAYLEYNNSLIFAKTNISLSGDSGNGYAVNDVPVFFGNEAVKNTHFKGRFSISSIKIGNKQIKVNKLTEYYDYGDFAASSYIDSVSDAFDDENRDLTAYFNANIKESGDYNIAFSAYDFFGSIIETKNESFSLNSGMQNVPVPVNGELIYGKKLSGPYLIKNIRLSKNNELMDFIDSYATQYYAFNNFSVPLLPDLYALIEVSDDYHYGISNISLNITVRNTGTKPAFNIFLDIFDNNTLNENRQLSAFNKNNSIKYSYNYNNAPDFEITAIADLNNFVEEGNESNNAVRKTIKINKKPILAVLNPIDNNPINSITINETDKITINLTAIDINNDALKYSINDSKFNNINNDSDYFNVLEWKTATTDSGNYTFIAAVSDGWLNDSVLFKISVNDRPEIDADNDGLNDSVDKVVGDVNDINTSTINSSIIIDGYSNLSRIFNETLEVKIKDSNVTVVEFMFNFSEGTLNLANLTIEKQGNEPFGFFIVKGINLPEGQTKSVYSDKIDNFLNGICLKDAEISSVSEISSNCDGINEFKVECDGTPQNGYSCAYNDSIGKYKISGLRHSGVKQIDYAKPSSSPSAENSGNPAGSSGGGGRAYITFKDSKNSSKNEALALENSTVAGNLALKSSRNAASAGKSRKDEVKKAAGNLITGFAALTGKVVVSKETKIVIFVAAIGVNAYLLLFRRIIIRKMHHRNKQYRKIKGGILIFIGISINILASMIIAKPAIALWDSYNDNIGNRGAAPGTGYFPLKTANFTADYGMGFQPLAGDLNNNGSNEIVIFYNNSLIIFDKFLNVIANKDIGALLGQPALFDDGNDGNIEIIFNSRNSSADYFNVYNYNNSSLVKKFHIVLSNDANLSGIRCINVNNSNICVFKDKINNINIVNIDSRNIDSYSLSNYNETRHTVPSIGDIDDDGNYEAVFWHNNDGGGGYGFLAFDLADRSIKWVVDDIFVSALGSPSTFILKGQPVLADLNDDNKIEIAGSVFYNDNVPSHDVRDDWFTELFVYSHDGTKLFSKCGQNTVSDVGCNDGASGTGGSSKWEGTNTFVFDYDMNGAEDICFLKDEKLQGYFAYMALNCYNYTGGEIAKVNLTDDTDGVKGNAVLADMNNDGSMEILTRDKVYLLNGASIFKYNFNDYFTNTFFSERVAPVPVDIDGNKGLDLLWTRGNRTTVFLDNSSYSLDLSIEAEDISFFKFDKTHVNVSAVIRNTGQIELNNVKAIIYNTETLENSTFNFNIRRSSNAAISSVIGIKEGEKVLIMADYDNSINETDEENNFAFKDYIGLPYVYVSSLVEPSNINSLFSDYIKDKLTSGYYTNNEFEADVKVYIGKNNPINIVNNVNFKNNYDFGYDYGSISYFDRKGIYPFNAVVGGFKDADGKIKIMIAGNEIEGTIAAVKEFIKQQPSLLYIENTNFNNAFYIDDENADAVKVYDYLHNSANTGNYNLNNDAFKSIVKNSLYDTMFTSTDKIVAASDGINLRLRNLKANFSDGFISYLNSTGVPVEIPVVLARGIHSNLTTWETLAGEIANDGRDVWLIEITGGPGQDCDDCPNYNFSDLTDKYWPALVDGVLDFTGKEKIQYVGHSNGGRTGIVSLANGSINPNKIETFIGVGVPGAFEGYSTFGEYFGRYGEEIMNELEGKEHIGLTEIASKMETICLNKADFGCFILTKGLKGENKMSFNVDKQYYLWINDTNDSQIGKDLQLGNFYLLQGWVIDNKNNNVSHDFIVTEEDEKALYGNIMSLNKKHYKVWGAHTVGWSSASLPDRDFTKSIIKDILNKKLLYKYKSNEINST